MYCPQCLAEYRDGFYECSDCRVPLALGRPPEPVVEPEPEPVAESAPGPAPNPLVQPVAVLETHDSFALSLAQSTLEDAGIDYVVTGDDALNITHAPWARGIGEIPLCNCTCWIMVAPEDESEARALLEPLANPEPLAEGSEVPS